MATLAALRVLAHQGGWDEILFVLAPLLVFGGLLYLARRRVDQIGQHEAEPVQPAEDQQRTDTT